VEWLRINRKVCMEAKELAFTKKRVDRPSIFLAGGK
jgi:hypothetical protein